MLFSFDPYLGLGFLSLLLFGLRFDWESAYNPLLKKVLKKERSETTTISTNNSTSSSSSNSNSANLDADTDLAQAEHGDFVRDTDMLLPANASNASHANAADHVRNKY